MSRSVAVGRSTDDKGGNAGALNHLLSDEVRPVRLLLCSSSHIWTVCRWRRQNVEEETLGASCRETISEVSERALRDWKVFDHLLSWAYLPKQTSELLFELSFISIQDLKCPSVHTEAAETFHPLSSGRRSFQCLPPQSNSLGFTRWQNTTNTGRVKLTAATCCSYLLSHMFENNNRPWSSPSLDTPLTITFRLTTNRLVNQ